MSEPAEWSWPDSLLPGDLFETEDGRRWRFTGEPDHAAALHHWPPAAWRVRDERGNVSTLGSSTPVRRVAEDA